MSSHKLQIDVYTARRSRYMQVQGDNFVKFALVPNGVEAGDVLSLKLTADSVAYGETEPTVAYETYRVKELAYDHRNRECLVVERVNVPLGEGLTREQYRDLKLDSCFSTEKATPDEVIVFRHMRPLVERVYNQESRDSDMLLRDVEAACALAEAELREAGFTEATVTPFFYNAQKSAQDYVARGGKADDLTLNTPSLDVITSVTARIYQKPPGAKPDWAAEGARWVTEDGTFSPMKSISVDFRDLEGY